MTMGANGWDDNEYVPMGPPGTGGSYFDDEPSYEPAVGPFVGQRIRERARGYRTSFAVEMRHAPTEQVSYEQAKEKHQARLVKPFEEDTFSKGNKMWGPKVHHVLQRCNDSDFVRSVAGFLMLRGYVTWDQFAHLTSKAAQSSGFLTSWEHTLKVNQLCKNCGLAYETTHFSKAPCPGCWAKAYHL